jgi:quercetin dioxygenase-like cupin family protein
MEADEPHAVLLAAGKGEALSDRTERSVRSLFEHPLIDVTWSRYGAGERGPDPHVHHEHVDAFYVVEGEFQFRVGPDVEPVRAPAGAFVAVPPNVVHTFDNESDATARWLNFHAPSTGFIAYLRGERESFDSFEPPASGGRSAADATVTPVGGGERFERSNRALVILGDEPQLSAIEIAFDPDFEIEPHHHDDHVDSFFVLEGEVEFAVGDRVVRAGPGTWMSAPPGAEHGFRNAGTSRARVLNIHAPDTGFADGIRSF